MRPLKVSLRKFNNDYSIFHPKYKLTHYSLNRLVYLSLSPEYKKLYFNKFISHEAIKFTPNDLKDLNREMYDKSISIIRNSNVIFCTKKTSLSYLMDAFNFDTVIVDDANLFLESEIIGLISKKCSRLILIGDDKQLSPRGYENSFFSKCIRKNKRNVIQLDQQYRMHPSILDFSNKYIYGNKPSIDNFNEIQTKEKFKEKFKDKSGFPWRSESERVMFINNHKDSIVVDNCFINTEEANEIVKLVNFLISDNKVNPEDIGIITPYMAQKFYIKHKLIHDKELNYKLALGYYSRIHEFLYKLGLKNFDEIDKYCETYGIDDFQKYNKFHEIIKVYNKIKDYTLSSRYKGISRGLVASKHENLEQLFIKYYQKVVKNQKSPIEEFYGLEISSIHDFLGKQKKYIILSTVKSEVARLNLGEIDINELEKNKKNGYFYDIGRFVVSTTRASHGLFILGHSDHLRNLGIWTNYIEYLENKHCICNFDDLKPLI
ncbi:uncharacterized protein ASCRUDRAFT_82553 [Ascoidea rubescens DSM 1968]|uniref:P-loop containing nucleoside triphosphate hydrolase protein n=1 Tax=Ascoidea rubescens DSM 1968 TaxID=1344418 RepID=A0A1D2VBD4_9ASCO|nr:hypothetical protein ASCRUDRAFT_82553 [Ascoidea rubescens DSM 1968]ODV58921.1 hypothetical protein ASCRUDRAFT_82553 [Ascoidea rubescens DSM 1968]